MASMTNRGVERAGRAIQITLATGLALAGPGLAHAGCTGFTTGNMTVYSCSDGTSFIQQKLGDFTHISGDLSGWGIETGGIGYWEVDQTRVPGYGVRGDEVGARSGAIGWGTPDE